MSMEQANFEFDGRPAAAMGFRVVRRNHWRGGSSPLQSTLNAFSDARQMFITLMHVHVRMQGRSMAEEYLANLVPLSLINSQTPKILPPQQSHTILMNVRSGTKTLSIAVDVGSSINDPGTYLGRRPISNWINKSSFKSAAAGGQQ